MYGRVRAGLVAYCLVGAAGEHAWLVIAHVVLLSPAMLGLCNDGLSGTARIAGVLVCVDVIMSCPQSTPQAPSNPSVLPHSPTPTPTITTHRPDLLISLTALMAEEACFRLLVSLRVRE